MSLSPITLKLIEHYGNLYKESAECKDLKLREYIKKYRAEHRVPCSRLRLTNNSQVIYGRYTPDPVNTITTCFKIHAQGSEAAYAFLYSSQDRSDKTTIVNCGAAFQSQDGEYRCRMSVLSDFLWNFTKINWSPVEEMMLEKIETGQIRLQAVHFYPAGTKKDDYEEYITSNRLELKFLMLAWLLDFPRFQNGTIENHINPNYVLTIYNSNDLPVWETFNQLNQSDDVSKLSGLYQTGTRSVRSVGAGQKIAVATIYEASRVGDINFPIWREMYIARLCSNLVINYVSPSFPLMGNWFFIHNISPDIFDNLPMHLRFSHSHVANTISSQLKTIEKSTHNPDGNFINGKFMRLSQKIHAAFMYADRELRLTSLGICTLSEYVGRTYRDLPVLRSHYPQFARMFEDPDIFAKMMFELVYGFYVMNKYYKVYHGDLHLNNMTAFIHGPNGFNELYVVYIVDGVNYVFQQTFTCSAVIDMSRAIIADVDRLINEFGERFTKLYLSEQESRIIQLMRKYFPKTIEKYPQLIGMISTNLPTVFKIMSAMDSYTAFANIAFLMRNEPSFKGFEHPAQNLELVDSMAQMAFDSVARRLVELATGRLDLNFDYPNFEILRKHFEPYQRTTDDIVTSNIKLMDYYEDSELKYTIDDYEHWHPLMKYDGDLEISKQFAEQEKDEDQKKQLALRVEDAKQVIARVHDDGMDRVEKMLEAYKLREDHAIQFEPWMLV